MRRVMWIGMFVTAVVATNGLATGRPHAGELMVAGSVEGAQTSWDDDNVAYLGVRGSYRWWPRVSLFFSAKSGAAEVDERGIQRLAAGAELWQPLGTLRSYARLALVHQHELPGDAIDDDPAGTLLGYGNGIRHRGGIGGALGAQLPFHRHKAGDLFVGLELTSDAIVGAVGPDYYWGIALELGFTYDFGASKRAR